MTPAIRIQQVRNIDNSLASVHTEVQVITFLGGDVGRVRAVIVNKNLRFEAIPIEELMFDDSKKELAKSQAPGIVKSNINQKEKNK